MPGALRAPQKSDRVARNLEVRAEPRYSCAVGLTYLIAGVANPARPGKSSRLKFLVDSGAAYSIVPAAVLGRLSIKPRTQRTFILADGAEVKRKMANALFLYRGGEAASAVIFGGRGTAPCSAWFRWKPWAWFSTPCAASCGPCRWPSVSRSS